MCSKTVREDNTEEVNKKYVDFLWQRQNMSVSAKMFAISSNCRKVFHAYQSGNQFLHRKSCHPRKKQNKELERFPKSMAKKIQYERHDKINAKRKLGVLQNCRRSQHKNLTRNIHVNYDKENKI